ncbi:protein kinase domain-containing protein [Pendulispora albinea]|uniref:Serine/threonine-protein kinase n=1 Tax=Pendulispora albinea TaxID=2741071 RepID=A0ABZ2LZA9_9BACT
MTSEPIDPRPGEPTVHGSFEPLKLGSRILGRLRIEQVLDCRESAALYLADDENLSELVLLVVAKSAHALAHCLDGPAAGTIVNKTTFESWHIAEIQLEESHLHHFAERLLAPTALTEKPQPPYQASPADRLAEGTLFAERYRIDGTLGHGGTGDVYRAYDRTFERAVAVKVVRVDPSEGTADREAAKRRLLNEARVASALKHPHIVEVYDAGESMGVPYLVLELCDGGSLRKAMAGEPREADRLRWLTETAEALAYAHAQGVIHRDVKPENVLLTAAGTAKVADFGIAKALRGDRARENTTVGIVGTPRYMAPEQLFGGKIDARVDQFAWGLVACELLTGLHPRSSELEKEALGSILDTPRLPTTLRRVIERAMANDPRARYADFGALLGDLRKPPRRRGWFAAIGVTAAVAIAGGALASSMGRGEGQVQPAVDANVDRAFNAEKTDAEIVGRCSPAARHHLSAGLQLWRDASQWAAASRFEEVTKVDPECASASLYYLLAASHTFPKRREHFRRARELRANLGDRERQLLDALEPTVADPPDFEEVLRRATALAERRPADLDVRIIQGHALFRLGRYDAALAAVDQTAALEPNPIPGNELLAAMVQIRRRDPSAAIERFRRCLAASPDSADCLMRRGLLLAAQGACREAQSEFRHLTAVMPHSARAQFDLANVLLTSTNDAVAARAAFEERERLYPFDALTFDPTREAGRLADEYRMATVSGDLATALRFVRKWNEEVETTNSGRYRGDALVELIELLRELDYTEEARELARKGLREHHAWTGDEIVDVGIELARLAYLTGGIDTNEYRAFRDEWVRHRRRSPVETWLGGFAGLPLVGAEMDPPLAPGEDAEDWLLMGQSPEHFLRAALELMRAGRTDDALRHAEAAAKDCLAYSPIAYVRAQFVLAKMRDAAGDVASACTQYAAVRDLLAKNPRSTSLRFSVKRMKELSCQKLHRQ